jgi:hypothetical protein
MEFSFLVSKYWAHAPFRSLNGVFRHLFLGRLRSRLPSILVMITTQGSSMLHIPPSTFGDEVFGFIFFTLSLILLSLFLSLSVTPGKSRAIAQASSRGGPGSSPG